MLLHHAWRVALSSLCALVLVCGGCTERGGDEPKTARSPEEARGIASDAPLAGEGKGEELFQLAGERDTDNRFPSAVIVISDVPNARWKNTQCSGVLVAPRLVLTAGHCVCKRRKQENTARVDASACAASAIVKTVVYDPPGSDVELSFQSRDYRGKVRPHPEFKLVLDAGGNVLESRADLAAIHLETAVRAEIPSVPLAEAEVAAHESLVAVGYNSDEKLGWVSDHRYFSRYKITRRSEAGEGRFLFEQPQRHRYRGDSGGPFLRESGQGFVLVGISARRLGSEPSLTGTYSYRAWIRDEIHRVMPAGPTAPH